MLITKHIISVSLLMRLGSVNGLNTSSWRRGKKTEIIYSSRDAIEEDIESILDDSIRFRGRIAYNGAGFNGWQVQSQARTVQGVLETVLSKRFSNRRIPIVGAGRTDKHVHARGQAFHFDLYPSEIPKDSIDFIQQLEHSLNKMLPADAKIFNLCESPPPVVVGHLQSDGSIIEKTHKWHVIYDAQKKLYTYRISLDSLTVAADPVDRFTRLHVEGNVNPDYLRSVLKHYEGTHNFRAFAGAIESNARKSGIEADEKDTVRTVYSVQLIEEGFGKFKIEILLKGALYKMVRNMVGVALDVCKGCIEEATMLELLHGGDKVRNDNKSKPAPPEGLTLEQVFYDEGF